jgi:hypothetical protein
MVVRWMPTVWAISVTVCSLLPSGPMAWYMRRTVAASASLSLRRGPPGLVVTQGPVLDQLTISLAELEDSQTPIIQGKQPRQTHDHKFGGWGLMHSYCLRVRPGPWRRLPDRGYQRVLLRPVDCPMPSRRPSERKLNNVDRRIEQPSHINREAVFGRDLRGRFCAGSYREAAMAAREAGGRRRRRRRSACGRRRGRTGRAWGVGRYQRIPLRVSRP